MLPALVGFASKALLPAAKKISKDKLLNRKKSSAIQKVDGEQGVVKEPKIEKKTISTNLFLPQPEIKALPPAAEVKKDVKSGNLKDIFKRVGETLQGIIDTLKNRNQTQKEEESNKKQKARVDEKKEREEKLEKDAKKKPVKGKIKTPKDKFNLMNFFGNVLLGSLALAIFENLEKIIDTLKNVYKQVTEFLEKLEEFFAPVWNAFKWIVGKGTELIGQLLGIPKEDLDDKDILKNLNEIKNKIPFLENLFNGINSTIESLRSGRGLNQEQPDGSGAAGPSSYASGTIPQSVSQDTAFTQGVTQLAQKYNVPEDYLYAVMGFETGGTFDPAQKNLAGSGATGLIQFMPSTAEGLGTTTEALSKMTRAEQLTYVDKYFASKDIQGGTLSDLYMAVLLPAAVGKPEDYVLFGDGGAYGGQRAYEQNKGLDLNNDGKITKAEATSKVAAYLPQGVSPTAQPAVSAEAKQIQDTGTYTVAGVTYDVKTGAPVQTRKPEDLQPAAQIPSSQTTNNLNQTTNNLNQTTNTQISSSQTTNNLNQTSITQAQVSSTQAPPAVSASVPQIMQQAEYEIPGGAKSAIVPIPMGGGSAPMMMGGGGTRVVPIGVSKQALLNSYYQTQLIGFLYKQG